eukprot:m.146456 g.146456  ORF g.146456 m.146456 type:complete len:347 (+) comp10092_c0_seq2:1511-2551(+)
MYSCRRPSSFPGHPVVCISRQFQAKPIKTHLNVEAFCSHLLLDKIVSRVVVKLVCHPCQQRLFGTKFSDHVKRLGQVEVRVVGILCEDRIDYQHTDVHAKKARLGAGRQGMEVAQVHKTRFRRPEGDALTNVIAAVQAWQQGQLELLHDDRFSRLRVVIHLNRAQLCDKPCGLTSDPCCWCLEIRKKIGEFCVDRAERHIAANNVHHVGHAADAQSGLVHRAVQRLHIAKIVDAKGCIRVVVGEKQCVDCGDSKLAKEAMDRPGKSLAAVNKNDPLASLCSRNEDGHRRVAATVAALDDRQRLLTDGAAWLSCGGNAANAGRCSAAASSQEDDTEATHDSRAPLAT